MQFFFLLKLKEGESYTREYIMKMYNLTSKLKALKIELSKELLVHLVLILLIVHFGQFKISYNTRTNGPLISLYIIMCKRKRGYTKTYLKVLI